MIGEMRNRVIVQVMSPTTDAGGGQSISWGTATTVWAKVENLSGSENFFGDQLEARSNYKFTIRYYSAITPKHRISYNSKAFNIQHIESVFEGKEKFQEITATEGEAT